MADVDPANFPLPEDEPQQPLQRDIKLPPFWTSRPRAWFTYVESRFRLRRITDDQQMFDHVLSALPAEMVSQVIDVVDALPAAVQYEFFKNELLNIHQLSHYEKFDMLVKMEPWAGGSPASCCTPCWSFARWAWSGTSPSTTSLCSASRRPCGPSWERYSLEILAPSPSEQTACGLCTPQRRLGPSPSPTARKTLRQPA
jgi:hypothetical protein